MSTTEALPEADASFDADSEMLAPAPLLPTPEKVSQLLEMDIEEVRTMFLNVSRRAELVDQIIDQQEALADVHSNITHEEISHLIDIAGNQLAEDPAMDLAQLELLLHEARSTFAAQQDFMLTTSPEALDSGEGKAAVLEKVTESKMGAEDAEERSLWGKAWDVITYMPRNHPVITTLIALAAGAWGIYALWDHLAAVLPVPNPMNGAAGVADQLVPPIGGDVTPIPDGDIALPNLDMGTGPEYVPDMSSTPDIMASPTAPDISGMPDPDVTDFFPDGPN